MSLAPAHNALALPAKHARVHLLTYDALPHSRQLVSGSYTLFTSLDALARSLPPASLPSVEAVQYYARISSLYRATLQDYITAITSQPQVDVAILDKATNILAIWHLAELLHIPSDGTGDAIVTEQLLHWLNSSDPQPSKQQAADLASAPTPYSLPIFWNYIYTSVLRGLFSQAASVLRSLASHPSTTISSLSHDYADLLVQFPRSSDTIYAQSEASFIAATQRYRANVLDALSNLDAEMDQFQAEADDTDARTGWEAGFKCLLELLAGDKDTVLEASETWSEALAAWALLVRPSLRRDDLPETLDFVLQALPHDTTVLPQVIQIDLIKGDIARVILNTSKYDTWLVAHLTDLFDKLALIENPNPSLPSFRDYFILLYTDHLLADAGLWRITFDYLASCSTSVGLERIRRLLFTIPISLKPKLEDNPPIEAEAPPSAEAPLEDLLAVCAQHNLETEARQLCIITADALIAKQKKYGSAIAYYIRAGSATRIAKTCDLLLDEYLLNGPLAFSNYMDEIPTSLLHPNAAALRPSLYAGMGESTLNIALFSSKLAFLARYRDFQALYAREEHQMAADLLVEMLSTGIAPKKVWAVLLIDAIALVEREELLFTTAGIFELQRCAQEILGPIKSTGRDIDNNLTCLIKLLNSKSTKKFETRDAERQLDCVRLALARGLARCFETV